MDTRDGLINRRHITQKSFLGDHLSVSSFTRLDKRHVQDMRGEEIGGRLQIPSLFGVAGLTNSVHHTRHRGQSNFGDAALE